MRYLVCFAKDNESAKVAGLEKMGIDLLEYRVNYLLEEGWEPIGGVVFNQGSVYQTLIYREPLVIMQEGEK